MTLRYLIAAIVSALGALTVSAAIGAKRPVFAGVLIATATGNKEVSATTGKKGAGDKDARVGFTGVIDGTRLCWAIVAKDVDGTPSGAHLHRGAPSADGPIVVSLEAPASADPGTSSKCQTISPSVAAALTKTAAKYYFNLHSTPRFPGGAARGQLSWITR